MSRNSTKRTLTLIAAAGLLIPAALGAGATVGHATLLAPGMTPAGFAVSTVPCTAATAGTAATPSDGNGNSKMAYGNTGNENTGNCDDGNELEGDNQTGNGQP
jgi:hypothetical protein